MRPKLDILALMQNDTEWWKPNVVHQPNYTIPAGKLNDECHAMEMLSSTGTGELVRGYGKMDGTKYRGIKKENTLQSAKDLRIGWSFRFYQDNDPKYTDTVTIGWFRSKHMLERPSQTQT